MSQMDKDVQELALSDGRHSVSNSSGSSNEEDDIEDSDDEMQPLLVNRALSLSEMVCGQSSPDGSSNVIPSFFLPQIKANAGNEQGEGAGHAKSALV